MRNIIVVVIVVALAVGYFLPVTQIRMPIDKTIAFILKEVSSWDWMFSEKDCGDIAQMEKDYCGKKAHD